MRADEAYVERFSYWARFQHAAVILLFGVLLVTGMPQKWPDLEASRWIVERLGGIFAARWLHRTTGFVFSGFLVVHLAVAIAGILARWMQPSLLVTRRDFRDALDNLRYYVGYAEAPPAFGRYDYRQKFEYWGLVLGAVVMTLTGFILYAPIFVSRFLPAELIPAAKVMHSNEALLAFLIVLVWHMYSAHLSPDVFPMDTSIFSGQITKERLRREHLLEHEERFGKQ